MNFGETSARSLRYVYESENGPEVREQVLYELGGDPHAEPGLLVVWALRWFGNAGRVPSDDAMVFVNYEKNLGAVIFFRG